MEKIKVLLCGTVFGQMYLKGVLKTEQFKLEGVLSTGSQLSKNLADKYGLKLHTSIDEIKENEYDLALVVIRSKIVGGKGTDIAQSLLEKGINVVQEQPVHYDEVIENFRLATKKKLFYKVNTFYPYLPGAKIFLKKLKELKEANEILSIDGCCSLPVLLPYLDLIGRISGSLKPYSIDKVVSSKACDYVFGTVSDIPFSIRVQGRKVDNKNQAFLLNEINVLTEAGNLKMVDVNAQVEFISKAYIVEEYLKAETVDTSKNKTVTEVLYDGANKKFDQLYEEIWPLAVKEFLEENQENIGQSKMDTAGVQYYLTVCQFWKNLYQRLEEE